MTAVIPLFGALPGGPEFLTIALIALFVPVTMAVIVYQRARSDGAEHSLAWAIGTFFAGLGGWGFGSVVVGLLYFTVRE